MHECPKRFESQNRQRYNRHLQQSSMPPPTPLTFGPPAYQPAPVPGHVVQESPPQSHPGADGQFYVLAAPAPYLAVPPVSLPRAMTTQQAPALGPAPSPALSAASLASLETSIAALTAQLRRG
ncbi:unnamed protein product [Phaeothamnion confervicola]